MKLISITSLTCALLLTGCMTWRTDYAAVAALPTATAGNTASLLAKADALAEDAGDRARLENAIAAYELVLETDGTNFDALSELGHLYILLGAGYGKSSAEKGRCFKQAADFNARAMYTNEDFKQRVDAGATLAEACVTLGKREMNAMGFWCQATFYYYKERLGVIGRVANFKWIESARAVIKHMNDVDDDWQRGGLAFSEAIVFIALPESVGGDKAKAKEYVNRAVTQHPDVMRNRWGRAKYYHSVAGDDDAFRKDLTWVLEQDVRGWGPYAWNVYFQADAKRMLDGMR